MQVVVDGQEQHKRYAIGVDYGTNSVRALVVDVADGGEVGLVGGHDYPSGEAGILLDPKDPNLARQNPADYIEGFYRVGRGGGRMRPPSTAGSGRSTVVGIGVDTTGSTPHPGRSRRHAAGDAARVPEEPGRPRLAVEGPHVATPRRPRSPRRRRSASDRLSGQVRRHLQQRVVLVEDPALQADGAEGVRGGLLLGRTGRLRSGVHHRQPRSRRRCRAASARPATRRCTNEQWGGLPSQAFLERTRSGAGRSSRDALRQAVPSRPTSRRAD